MTEQERKVSIRADTRAFDRAVEEANKVFQPEQEAEARRPPGTLEGNPEGWSRYVVELEAALAKAEQELAVYKEREARYKRDRTELDRIDREAGDV